MSTRYTPSRETIGNLLSMTKPPILVPEWQRNYSWTLSEVGIFWADLLKFSDRYAGEALNAQEYFLGSIVLVERTDSHLLLDGQQRLATAAILLSVIRDFLAQFDQNASNRISNRYLTDFDDANQATTYKLTLNRYDRDFFKREILEARSASYAAPEPTIESHLLIRKAREYFFQKFTEKYTEQNNPRNSFLWSQRILKVLTAHFSLVSITSEDEDNAATVFETLNDRGIGLSTPDLLRNLVMRRALPEHREEILDLWGEILQIESDAKLRIFLRHYWISNEGDVKSQSLYREIKDHIESNNINSLDFSRNLRDASNTYRDMLSGQDDDEEVSQTMKDINELGANVLYPAILSAYSLGSVREQLKKILKALLIAYVRYIVIGKLDSSRFEVALFKMAKEIRDGASYDSAIAELKALAPNNVQFVEAFKSVTFSENSAARYILREIENAMRRTEELTVAPPPRVHVEHIYPKKPLSENRLANHLSVVYRLGNLTLLSRRLNTSIKNGTFVQKKPAYAISEIYMTSKLAELDSWDENSVITRQALLAEKALPIWSFEAS